MLYLLVTTVIVLNRLDVSLFTIGKSLDNGHNAFMSMLVLTVLIQEDHENCFQESAESCFTPQNRMSTIVEQSKSDEIPVQNVAIDPGESDATRDQSPHNSDEDGSSDDTFYSAESFVSGVSDQVALGQELEQGLCSYERDSIVEGRNSRQAVQDAGQSSEITEEPNPSETRIEPERRLSHVIKISDSE